MGLFKMKPAKEIQTVIDELHPVSWFTVGMEEGLPIPHGKSCQVYYCKDKVVIIGNNTRYELPMGKISNICLTTDAEIMKSYVSSAGGAVAGAMLFGVVGAAIGGRAKEKTSLNVTKLIVISYDEEKHIALSYDSMYEKQIMAAVKEFATHKPESAVVTL